MKMRMAMLASVALLAGCNDSSNSGSSSDTDSTNPPGEGFPSFYALTQEVLPAGMEAALTATRTAREALPSDYTADADEFTRAFSVSENYIGQVLNDAGPSGPVKSMFVLLAQADNLMDTLNSQYTDEDGNPTNCTEIAAETSVTTPFFDTADNPPFNAWDDAGKYTCYVEEDSERRLFGRQLIADAAEDCTDPYEYFVMSASSVDDEENTENVEERGSTRDLAVLQKFYYNGCSKDLQLAFAQSTLYSAGVEFSSRSEISGNVSTHTFSLRADYIDAAPSYADHITLAGTGTSQLDEGTTGSAAHFVMGYRSDNCGNSDDSSVCTTGTARTFCVKNEGSGNEYALESDTDQCTDLLSEYQSIMALERSDLPNGFFDTSTSVLGL